MNILKIVFSGFQFRQQDFPYRNHVKAQVAVISQPEMRMTTEDMAAKAEKGYTIAQYFQGTLYLSIPEEGKNQQKAVSFVMQSAEQGFQMTQFFLSRGYS